MNHVNSLDDLEEITPVKDDFYYYPDDNKLAISRDGRVIYTSNGKIIKHHPIKNKTYLKLVVYNNGKPKARSLYRLITRTFIGRPSRHIDKSFDVLEVNHIDGCGLNNAIFNLEWVTSKENADHAENTGLITRHNAIDVRCNMSGDIK